jgi:hypothetical protein
MFFSWVIESTQTYLDEGSARVMFAHDGGTLWCSRDELHVGAYSSTELPRGFGGRGVRHGDHGERGRRRDDENPDEYSG